MTAEPPLLLVIGASGFVGQLVVAAAGPRWRLAGTYLTRPPDGLAAFPLEVRDAAAVSELLARLRPAVVLHLAYRQQVPSINLDGTRNVARACAEQRARLVFVSTDMVFSGRRGWYREGDLPSPIEPYGASKAAAEAEALAVGAAVARTSVVYGFEPLDAVTRGLLVEPLREGRPTRLFADEFRCPTYGPDLAAALLELCALPFRGPIHLAGPRRLSRWQLGQRLAYHLGLDFSAQHPSLQRDSGLIRPADPSLDTSLARRLLRTRFRSIDEIVGYPSQ